MGGWRVFFASAGWGQRWSTPSGCGGRVRVVSGGASEADVPPAIGDQAFGLGRGDRADVMPRRLVFGASAGGVFG